MKKLINVLGILILFSSCNFTEESNKTLQKTDFVTTLESPFNIKTNIVYGATIPIAWNEIKTIIGDTITKFTSNELENINKSNSFLSVLKDNEYKTSVEISGEEISARAYFRKSLPFIIPLTKFEDPLKFGNSDVESFGFLGKEGDAKINYFNNENDFSISLLPANEEHEIILILYQRGKDNYEDFKHYFERYLQEKKRVKNLDFSFEDKVEIPIIEFDLEKSYEDIIGSEFHTKSNEFEIKEMYQRNAFILNEKGSEVESLGSIHAVAEYFEELENSGPKMMIFNKPFVLFLKRKDASYPYFGVYIANDELLKRK